MKSSLCAIFFSCVLAVVSAQLCREQEECDETQCCAGLNPLMGGICQNFTAEGGKCHLVDRIVPMFGEFYLGPCPCAEGLVCVQQGKKKNNGICQKPVTTTAAPVTAEEATDASADNSAADDSASDDSASDDSASDDSASDDSASDDSASDDSASDDSDSDDSASDDSASDDSAADDSAADASAAEQPAAAPEAE